MYSAYSVGIESHQLSDAVVVITRISGFPIEYGMEYFTVTSFVTTCVVIYTLFKIVPKLLQLRNLIKVASKFPGPPTLPIIGNAHLLSGSDEDLVKKFLQFGELYPSPYRLWLGTYLLYVINTPEQLKAVLVHPKITAKGDFHDFIKPWLGTGLLTASGAEWQQSRKLIQPTFSSTVLKSFVEVFVAQSEILADKIKQYLGGPEFDIHDYVSQCSLRTLCGTTMGVDLGVHTNDGDYYAEAIEDVIAGICKRVRSPWLHPDFIFYRTKLGRDQEKYIEFLRNFGTKVIQTKKKELLEQNRLPGSADNDEDADWTPRRKALLDHLLEISQDGRILSDDSLREEVDTIIAAGTDTLTITNSFVMLMLASHPEIQGKVYEELCEIYENDDTEEIQVTPEDLTRMTYLERVIKETMRLFPAGPTLVRSVTEDVVIGEHALPAGSLLLLSVIELHRNKEYWPNPLKFDPDRFLPEEVEMRHSYSYLPFGGGPRTCIGYKFAMMSMKAFFATILRKYILKKDNIVPEKDIRIKWEFLLQPVDSITLRIESRKRKVASI